MFGDSLRGPGFDDRADGGVPSSLHLLQLGLKSLDLRTGTATQREGWHISRVLGNKTSTEQLQCRTAQNAIPATAIPYI